MKKFAKLYETEEMGQVLCLAEEDNGEGKEALKIFFDPEEADLDVCSIDIAADKDGYAAELLEAMTREKAVELASNAKQEIKQLMS